MIYSQNRKKVNFIWEGTLLKVIAFILICQAPISYALGIKEAIRVALVNASELKANKESYDSSLHKLDENDHYFDGTISGKFFGQDDKSKSLGSQINRNQSTGFELEYRTVFGWSTQLGVKLSGRKTELEFNEQGEPVEITPGVTMPGFDPADQFSHNPSYTPKFEITMIQPIWKMTLGDVVNNLKKSQSLDSLEEKLKLELNQQKIAYEAENLYLAQVFLQESVLLMSALLELSKKFHESVKDLAKIGRGDKLDLISAHSRHISTKVFYSQVKSSLDIAKKRLFNRVYPDAGKSKVEVIGRVSEPLFEKQISKDEILNKIASQRKDIKWIEGNRQALLASKALSENEDSLDLNLFSNFGLNAIHSESKELGKELKKADTPNITFGINFSKKLGGSKPKSRLRAIENGIKALDYQKKNILTNVKNEIELTIDEWKHNQDLQIELKSQLRVLDEKIALGMRRYKQARAEKPTILRYRIEKKEAEKMLLETQFKLRQNEAKLRFLSHDYGV